MKETKTIQNLMNAFAGESQAFQRYMMFAKVAKKEGWTNISAIFEETAINEEQHAKEYYKLMCEVVGEENMPEMMTVNAAYPITKKNDTHFNLIQSAQGEHEENVDYTKFAEEAKEEGFTKAATKFRLIAEIEERHSNRYSKLAELLKAEKLISKDESVQWKCMKCGHIHTGKEAPGKCPVCDHAQGYFEKYELNI